MRKFYFVRHGATELNGEGGATDRIRGWTNVPLSAAGREDAKKVAKELAHAGIDVIVTSDLDRAHDTAKEIAKTTGAKIISTHKLRPWDLGELHGQSSRASTPRILEHILHKPDEAVPKGESFNNFKNRAFEGLHEAINGHGHPDKKVAIVSHHRMDRLLAAWQKKGMPHDRSLSVDEFTKKGGPPGEARHVEIDEGALGSHTQNLSTFLPMGLLSKATRVQLIFDLPSGAPD